MSKSLFVVLSLSLLCLSLSSTVCPDNCKYCDDEGYCTECYSGYYVDNNWECRSCSKDFGTCCSKCSYQKGCTDTTSSYGQYIYQASDYYYYCDYCIEGCEKCHDGLYCEKCKQQYWIDTNYQCKKCLGGCKECHGPDYCDSCLDGYFHDTDYKCYKCAEGCKICASRTECLSCSWLYNSDGKGGCALSGGKVALLVIIIILVIGVIGFLVVRGARKY